MDGTAGGRLAGRSRCRGHFVGPSAAARRARRIQLPAGGRHVRARTPDESVASAVAALRDAARDSAADLRLEVSSRPRSDPGVWPSRGWQSRGRIVVQCRRGGRGRRLDAGRLDAAAVGAVGRRPGRPAPRNPTGLDAKLLGRKRGVFGGRRGVGRLPSAAARGQGPRCAGAGSGTGRSGQQPAVRGRAGQCARGRRNPDVDHAHWTGAAGGRLARRPAVGRSVGGHCGLDGLLQLAGHGKRVPDAVRRPRGDLRRGAVFSVASGGSAARVPARQDRPIAQVASRHAPVPTQLAGLCGREMGGTVQSVVFFSGPCVIGPLGRPTVAAAQSPLLAARGDGAGGLVRVAGHHLGQSALLCAGRAGSAADRRPRFPALARPFAAARVGTLAAGPRSAPGPGRRVRPVRLVSRPSRVRRIRLPPSGNGSAAARAARPPFGPRPVRAGQQHSSRMGL